LVPQSFVEESYRISMPLLRGRISSRGPVKEHYVSVAQATSMEGVIHTVTNYT
jgi:hypothetical protein